MVLEIIGIMLAIIILSIIINGVEDYCKQRKRVDMSFKEAMDLVDLPVITFYNNGNKFNFLLDTGATMTVIDSNVLNSLSHEKILISFNVAAGRDRLRPLAEQQGNQGGFRKHLRRETRFLHPFVQE